MGRKNKKNSRNHTPKTKQPVQTSTSAVPWSNEHKKEIEEPIHFSQELLNSFEFGYIYTFLPTKDWYSHSFVSHQFHNTLMTDSMFESILKRDYKQTITSESAKEKLKQICEAKPIHYYNQGYYPNINVVFNPATKKYTMVSSEADKGENGYSGVCLIFNGLT
jgi:hypothetical protein